MAKMLQPAAPSLWVVIGPLTSLAAAALQKQPSNSNIRYGETHVQNILASECYQSNQILGHTGPNSSSIAVLPSDRLLLITTSYLLLRPWSKFSNGKTADVSLSCCSEWKAFPSRCWSLSCSLGGILLVIQSWRNYPVYNSSNCTALNGYHSFK